MSRMLSKMNLISVVQQLPKEYIETIQGYVEMIEQENQELKKQLEDYRMDIIDGKPYIKLELVLNKQKEFIEWLENEMKLWTEALNKEHDYELVQKFYFKRNTYEEILSKYKEIIGVKDER